MSDAKFFATTKKGEIAELRQELRNVDKTKRKDTVKRVIAMMTVGQDVSALFPDVVNCMQTDDLELKKLVYLYIINYAKTQPDLAIMAVNTFVKDASDGNPLIRALAVRTMGCIRVDKITEYLCDPLQNCLKDSDPYVRKTAAVCVAKLYDINAELVEDRGFLDMLKDMLADANPTVVANSVAALMEISEVSGKPALTLTPNTLYKLLAALNECGEWGQVFLLDCIAEQPPSDPKEAEQTVDRVMSRLQHANPSVVLSAVKVVLKCLEVMNNDDRQQELLRKLAPPLVTLLTNEPEVQYVALRNINLIVQKHTSILHHEVKVFFCKYNDPIYVKMEKLDIMVKLASEKNIDQVLLELKEYAQEVDVDFVRRSVRAIGTCAVALEKAAEKCINVLLELITTKVSYVVQESVIVIKDIFRRYPNQYESIIAELCENLDSLDEPEARAAMVWIIGEYAERIDNADELLAQFLDSFPEETSQVQLQLLTATVKLFLKKPVKEVQDMISLVLSCATQETDNPDLRDRGFVYWRLLSSDAEAAQEVVLAEKPLIKEGPGTLDTPVLSTLLGQLSTLSSVYHKPPETFVSRTRLAVQRAEDMVAPDFTDADNTPQAPTSQEEVQSAANGSTPTAAPAAAAGGDLLDLLDMSGVPPPAAPAAAPMPAAAGGDLLDDVLGGLTVSPAATPAAAVPAAAPAAAADPLAGLAGPAAGGADLLAGLGVAVPAPAPAAPAAVPAWAGGQLRQLVSREQSQGCAISGAVAREGSGLVYRFAITNSAAGPLDGFMIQLNKNSFGLQPATQVLTAAPAPGETAYASVDLLAVPDKSSPPPASLALQVAMKYHQCPAGVLYFHDSIPAQAVLEVTQPLEANTWLQQWQTLPEPQTQQVQGRGSPVETVLQQLQAGNTYLVAQRPVPATPGQVALFMSAQVQGTPVLMDLKVTPGVAGVAASAKSTRADLVPLVFQALTSLLA